MTLVSRVRGRNGSRTGAMPHAAPLLASVRFHHKRVYHDVAAGGPTQVRPKAHSSCLRGLADPGLRMTDEPKGRWSAIITAQELLAKVRSNGKLRHTSVDILLPKSLEASVAAVICVVVIGTLVRFER